MTIRLKFLKHLNPLKSFWCINCYSLERMLQLKTHSNFAILSSTTNKRSVVQQNKSETILETRNVTCKSSFTGSSVSLQFSQRFNNRNKTYTVVIFSYLSLLNILKDVHDRWKFLTILEIIFSLRNIVNIS